MSNTIIVASSTGRAKRVNNFTGSTWGELRQHPDVSPLLTSGQEVIINPGNLTVRGDDSLLPEGSFNVYLVPTKNKAGYSDAALNNLAKVIGDAIVQAGRKSHEDDLFDLQNEIVDVIENFFNVEVNLESGAGSSVSAEDVELQRAVAQAQSLAR